MKASELRARLARISRSSAALTATATGPYTNKPPLDLAAANVLLLQSLAETTDEGWKTLMSAAEPYISRSRYRIGQGQLGREATNGN